MIVYLGSLGDLLPLDIFGDFLPTQSSLSSISLESEQLQLSIIADIRLLPYISSEENKSKFAMESSHISANVEDILLATQKKIQLVIGEHGKLLVLVLV